MTLTIRLPERAERRLRDRAAAEGVSVDVLAASLLESITAPTPETTSEIPDEWIDHEFHAQCERLEGKSDDASLEEVRRILSKIPGNLSDEIIADREERF